MWNQGKSAAANVTISDSKSAGHPTYHQENDKKIFQDKRETDSGFISGGINSSEQLYSSDEEQNHQSSEQSPQVKIIEPCFDSGLVESREFVSSEEEDFDKSEPQMIVERAIDNGVNEWFCKLSLKETNEPINNLGHTMKTTPVDSKKSKTIDAAWETIYAQNEDGDTQLHICVIVGCEKYIDSIIKLAPHQCFLDTQNDIHQTALHLAVLTSQPSMVRRLVNAGSKVSVRDTQGNTALHLACLHGELDCAKEILANTETMDLQQWNYNGETCVHLAAKNNQIQILRYLVQAGADINVKEGKSGLTALHIAIEQSNEEMANYLLDECPKLRIEIRTYAGLTAYQLAAIQHNQMLVSSLMDKGAETLSPPDSEVDSDSDDDQIAQYYGANNVFKAFNGPSTIHVA